MTARSRYVIDGFMDMYLGPGVFPYLYEGENAYRNRLCVLDVKGFYKQESIPFTRGSDPNASTLSLDDISKRDTQSVLAAVASCPQTPEYLISETYFLELYATQIKALDLFAHLSMVQAIPLEDFDGIFEDFTDYKIAKCLILREDAIEKYSTERRQIFTAWDDVTVPASVKNCFPSSTLP